jgi:hypothetical protein
MFSLDVYSEKGCALGGASKRTEDEEALTEATCESDDDVVSSPESLSFSSTDASTQQVTGTQEPQLDFCHNSKTAIARIEQIYGSVNLTCASTFVSRVCGGAIDFLDIEPDELIYEGDDDDEVDEALDNDDVSSHCGVTLPSTVVEPINEKGTSAELLMRRVPISEKLVASRDETRASMGLTIDIEACESTCEGASVVESPCVECDAFDFEDVLAFADDEIEQGRYHASFAMDFALAAVDFARSATDNAFNAVDESLLPAATKNDGEELKDEADAQEDETQKTSGELDSNALEEAKSEQLASGFENSNVVAHVVEKFSSEPAVAGSVVVEETSAKKVVSPELAQEVGSRTKDASIAGEGSSAVAERAHPSELQLCKESSSSDAVVQRPLQSCKSRRRIIGAVVRTPKCEDAESLLSPTARHSASQAHMSPTCPGTIKRRQAATTSMHRLDEDAPTKMAPSALMMDLGVVGSVAPTRCASNSTLKALRVSKTGPALSVSGSGTLAPFATGKNLAGSMAWSTHTARSNRNAFAS